MFDRLRPDPNIRVADFTYLCRRTTRTREAGRRYPFSRDGWRRARWYSALRAADLDGFRFHDLRHTTGSRITKARGLALAKKLLGHRSIDTTLRYSHVLTEDVAEAMDSVSRSGPEKKEPGAQTRPSVIAFDEREKSHEAQAVGRRSRGWSG